MEVFNFSHIGKRNYQEDAFFIHENENLFIVCDGVGGSANGAKASLSVVETIEREFEKYDQVLNEQRLIEMIRYSQEYLHEISVRENIATTIALLYLKGNTAHTVHLGDSRVYHIRVSDNYCWTTKDHSVVQELYDAGVLVSECQVKEHPMRNRITKAISSSSKIELPEIQKIPDLQDGDLFMICTDGVLESYDNAAILTLFKKNQIQDAWRQLSDHCKANSNDNSTCILIKI